LPISKQMLMHLNDNIGYVKGLVCEKTSNNYRYTDCI
jgi:hypothetical protein